MKAAEIKSDLHRMIDQIEDDFLLNSIYADFKNFLQVANTGIWEKLTETQREEVILSLKESDDEGNLLTSDEVLSKYSKWLSK
jgi:hypothetical protein